MMFVNTDGRIFDKQLYPDNVNFKDCIYRIALDIDHDGDIKKAQRLIASQLTMFLNLARSSSVGKCLPGLYIQKEIVITPKVSLFLLQLKVELFWESRFRFLKKILLWSKNCSQWWQSSCEHSVCHGVTFMLWNTREFEWINICLG